MFLYILKKIKYLTITMLGVSMLSFFLLRIIPGDPVLLLLGERGSDPALYHELQHQMGLDKSIPLQYLTFLKNAIKGDLGTSIISKESVSKEFFDRFPATLELSICAMLFSILIGIPLGILAAIKKNKLIDYVISVISLIGYSIPLFWWALILILIFSVTYMWTPVSGRISVFYEIHSHTGFLLLDTLSSSSRQMYGFSAFFDCLKHLILPSLALGTIPLALITRMTRSSMIDVLVEPYIKTAFSKGLPLRKIYFIHALKNALIPIITIASLIFGSLITGAILTETIFSWPGIGKWLVSSINARDYPVIQAATLYIASFIVIINTLTDISYAFINPQLNKNNH